MQMHLQLDALEIALLCEALELATNVLSTSNPNRDGRARIYAMARLGRKLSEVSIATNPLPPSVN